MPLDGLRVLVIEDDADTRTALAALLDMWGSTVELAASGREALAKATPFHPDVALVDLELPDTDGTELAAPLRAVEGKPPALIAFTGHAYERDRARAAEAGFQWFFAKPGDPDRLHDVLRAIRAQRPLG